MRPIDSEALNTPVTGVNLQPGTLRDQLAGSPALLVFLRHFGCPFCREAVKDLRKLAAANPAYPSVLFAYQGSVEDGEDFFARFWPEARAIADPTGRLYAAFGVEHAKLGQMVGPEVMMCTLRALSKGNIGGRPTSDTTVMPGFFVVAGGAILWEYKPRHIGDHPDFARLSDVATQGVGALA